MIKHKGECKHGILKELAPNFCVKCNMPKRKNKPNPAPKLPKNIESSRNIEGQTFDEVMIKHKGECKCHCHHIKGILPCDCGQTKAFLEHCKHCNPAPTKEKKCKCFNCHMQPNKCYCECHNPVPDKEVEGLLAITGDGTCYLEKGDYIKGEIYISLRKHRQLLSQQKQEVSRPKLGEIIHGGQVSEKKPFDRGYLIINVVDYEKQKIKQKQEIIATIDKNLKPYAIEEEKLKPTAYKVIKSEDWNKLKNKIVK